jgi:hypothetical protein
LGVDDWSFQARSAGTLLVDLEHHRPVEVLLGSDEQVLSDWLLAHPGVEVISRDRGASYLKVQMEGESCRIRKKYLPHFAQYCAIWGSPDSQFGRNTCRNSELRSNTLPSFGADFALV